MYRKMMFYKAHSLKKKKRIYLSINQKAWSNLILILYSTSCILQSTNTLWLD